jgi:hypothetical protein
LVGDPEVKLLRVKFVTADDVTDRVADRRRGWCPTGGAPVAADLVKWSA